VIPVAFSEACACKATAAAPDSHAVVQRQAAAGISPTATAPDDGQFFGGTSRGALQWFGL
jgi:hypothetical protein